MTIHVCWWKMTVALFLLAMTLGAVVLWMDLVALRARDTKYAAALAWTFFFLAVWTAVQAVVR